jgi:peroxiredoxin
MFLMLCGVTDRHKRAEVALPAACARTFCNACLTQGKLKAVMGASRQSELLRAGQHAPDFTLQRLENGAAGAKVQLLEILRAGPGLLAFYKSTCPVCQMTLPFLERVHQAHTPGLVQIYGVSQDDAETTAEFSQEFRLSFPMLLDTEEGGYHASNAFSISHVPSLFLVERDGMIAWSLEGFNKREFTAVFGQLGINPFRQGENVPEWKAG